jgi:hypothetical protein
MRRLLPFIFLAIAACSTDSTTGPTGSIAGTWTLQTVNGFSLPFTIEQTVTDKVELLSDVIVISGTGSFTQTATVRTTTNGAATTQSAADAGTYTLNGTAITLHFNSDGSTGTGSWSGNTITTTDGGLALVFKR